MSNENCEICELPAIKEISRAGRRHWLCKDCLTELLWSEKQAGRLAGENICEMFTDYIMGNHGYSPSHGRLIGPCPNLDQIENHKHTNYSNKR